MDKIWIVFAHRPHSIVSIHGLKTEAIQYQKEYNIMRVNEVGGSVKDFEKHNGEISEVYSMVYHRSMGYYHRKRFKSLLPEVMK